MTVSPIELRERLGLSRSDWARALNVQEKTVMRWEETGTLPGGLAEEIMCGLVTAIDDGVDPRKVGSLVNLGGIRSLICYALVKRASAQNGHAKPPRSPPRSQPSGRNGKPTR